MAAARTHRAKEDPGLPGGVPPEKRKWSGSLGVPVAFRFL